MEPLTIIAAVLVAVLGVYRLARIIIWDVFPPAVWLRIQWDNLTYDKAAGEFNSWNKLLHCPWCLIPWIMLVAIGWFFGSLYGPEWVAWTWWLFWGWLALSGVSSMVYVRDERPER
jgi:hypothetical protein